MLKLKFHQFSSALLGLSLFLGSGCGDAGTDILGDASVPLASEPSSDFGTEVSLSVLSQEDVLDSVDSESSSGRGFGATASTAGLGFNVFGQVFQADGEAGPEGALVVLSRDRFVVEATSPTLANPTGTRLITGYAETLAPGVNFTDSNGNGLVDSLEEKATITSSVLSERETNFVFDFDTGQQAGSFRTREYASVGTLDRFTRTDFTSELAFLGNPSSLNPPFRVESEGSQVVWTGEAAEQAFITESAGGEGDLASASAQGRFRGIWDILASSSVLDNLSSAVQADGTHRLLLGRSEGSLIFNGFDQSLSGSRTGQTSVFERSSSFDLDNEAPLTEAGFQFQPGSTDTQIVDATRQCDFVLAEGASRLDCSITGNLRNLQFDFVAEDGSLVGEVLDLENDGSTVADIVVNRDRTGTVTFDDGTVVQLPR